MAPKSSTGREFNKFHKTACYTCIYYFDTDIQKNNE